MKQAKPTSDRNILYAYDEQTQGMHRDDPDYPGFCWCGRRVEDCEYRNERLG